MTAAPDLGAVFDEHVACEFVEKDVDATMRTMTAEPSVWHVPVLTGAAGGHRAHRRVHILLDELAGDVLIEHGPKIGCCAHLAPPAVVIGLPGRNRPACPSTAKLAFARGIGSAFPGRRRIAKSREVGCQGEDGRSGTGRVGRARDRGRGRRGRSVLPARGGGRQVSWVGSSAITAASRSVAVVGGVGMAAGSLAGMAAADAASGLRDKMLVGATATMVYGFAASTRHDEARALAFQVPPAPASPRRAR